MWFACIHSKSPFVAIHFGTHLLRSPISCFPAQNRDARQCDVSAAFSFAISALSQLVARISSLLLSPVFEISANIRLTLIDRTPFGTTTTINDWKKKRRKYLKKPIRIKNRQFYLFFLIVSNALTFFRAPRRLCLPIKPCNETITLTKNSIVFRFVECLGMLHMHFDPFSHPFRGSQFEI